MSIALAVFVIVCFGILLWAIQTPRRLMSCPFQVAGTSIFFILPQLFVLQHATHLAPRNGVITYTVYSAFCIAATFVGYTMQVPSYLIDRRDIREQSLYRLAIAVAVTGLVGEVALVYYLTYIGVSGLWQGWPVYLYTMSKLVIPGLVIFRTMTLLFQRQKYAIWTYILLVPIAVQAFGFGRRSWFFMLVFSWFLPLVLMRKIKMRRAYALVGIALAFFVIVMFPAYRDRIRAVGYSNVARVIRERPPSQVLRHYFSGKQTLEVRDACVLMAAVEHSGEHSFGIRMVNGLIKQYVPGGLVGREFKKTIMLPVPDYEKLERQLQMKTRHTGGEVRFYTSKTGFFFSYAEFWWFGALLYFFMGRLYRRIEDACYDHRSSEAILALAFVGFIPAAVVYGEWHFVIATYLPAIVLVFITKKYALGPVASSSISQGGTALVPGTVAQTSNSVGQGEPSS